MAVLRLTTVLALLFSVCLLFSTAHGRPRAPRHDRSAGSDSDSDSDSSSNSSEENDNQPPTTTTTTTTTATPGTTGTTQTMTTLEPVMTTCVVRGDGTLSCSVV